MNTIDPLDNYVWVLRCDVPGLGVAGSHLHLHLNEPFVEGAWFVASLDGTPTVGRCFFDGDRFRLRLLDGASCALVRDNPGPGEACALGAVFMNGYHMPD